MTSFTYVAKQLTEDKLKNTFGTSALAVDFYPVFFLSLISKRGYVQMVMYPFETVIDSSYKWFVFPCLSRNQGGQKNSTHIEKIAL